MIDVLTEILNSVCCYFKAQTLLNIASILKARCSGPYIGYLGVCGT